MIQGPLNDRVLDATSTKLSLVTVGIVKLYRLLDSSEF